MGNRLPSTTPSIVLRLLGHRSTGPSFVLDQSVERMIAPISPPPGNKSVGAPIIVFPQPDEPIGRLVSLSSTNQDGFARRGDIVERVLRKRLSGRDRRRRPVFY